MNRVALCLGGYVCGLVLAQYLDLPLSAVFSGYCLLLLLLLQTRRPTVSLYGLLLFCLLTGFLRYPAQVSPTAACELEALVGRGVLRLEGQVVEIHERPDNGLAVDLQLLKVESSRISFPADNRVRLFIGSSANIPLVGSRVAFRSQIRRTRNFGIPGEFDYVRHLAYQGTWHTAYLADARGLAIFANPPGGFRAWIASLRRAGLEVLDRTLDAEDAILLKGLLLGEKGAMSTALRQQLAAGGVSHLFAISGLHFGLLAFLMYALLKYIYSRSTRLLLWQPPVRVLWLAILPVLFLYLLLTGDALATRRAFYALLITASLCLWRRRIEPLNLLYALAFLFLLFEPLALWQPSFLLSFSGVLGILLWQKPLGRLLHCFPRWVQFPLQLFGVSLAAFIATLPAVIYVFHMLAPAGLLCNLLAVPLVSFAALPLGLAGLGLYSVLPGSAESLLQAAAWVLQLVVDLAGLTSTLPGFISKSLFLSLPETAAVLLACVSLLLLWQQKKTLILTIPAVFLLAFGLSTPVSTELILFSVGQGESMLLRTEGKALLIDGGGLGSDHFEVGERLLAPALGKLGVKSLDAIILTHDHPDHSGGLNYLIENFEVHEFWSTAETEDLRPDLRQVLLEKGVETHTYDIPGWREPAPGGLKSLSMFTAAAGLSGENNHSLCLYYPTPAGGILLTGDLESGGVESLLKTPLPGKVSFLKAPHHGSRGSSPKTVLAQLLPEIVMVSAGYQNTYHFPAQELLDQAQAQGVRVWRTDLDGTVRLRVAEKSWRVDHWVNGLFR